MTGPLLIDEIGGRGKRIDRCALEGSSARGVATALMETCSRDLTSEESLRKQSEKGDPKDGWLGRDERALTDISLN